jgi:hypothetical protein
MALVDGHRSLRQICEMSDLGYDETMVRLARLKLAGLIVPAEAKSVVIQNDSLNHMVDRLANLFEDYLNQKSHTAKTESRISTTLIEEQN